MHILPRALWNVDKLLRFYFNVPISYYETFPRKKHILYSWSWKLVNPSNSLGRLPSPWRYFITLCIRISHVITDSYCCLLLIYVLCTSLQQARSLLSQLCLHQSSPGNRSNNILCLQLEIVPQLTPCYNYLNRWPMNISHQPPTLLIAVSWLISPAIFLSSISVQTAK